jgi:hypothetical protein
MPKAYTIWARANKWELDALFCFSPWGVWGGGGGGGCGQMVPVVLARKDFPNLLYLTGYDPVAAVDVYALDPACFWARV